MIYFTIKCIEHFCNITRNMRVLGFNFFFFLLSFYSFPLCFLSFCELVISGQLPPQGSKVRRETRDKERYERRVLDELSKMFNDSDSFYYSMDTDLTSSLQRQSDPEYDAGLPLWRRAEDDYFWNKHLLGDLIEQDVSCRIELEGMGWERFKSFNIVAIFYMLFTLQMKVQSQSNLQNPCLDVWIVPVIQGFVETASVPLETAPTTPDGSQSQVSAQSQKHWNFLIEFRFDRKTY